MSIAIIRKPSLMEDEGRFFLLGVFDSWEKAAECVKRYLGYFCVSDLAYLTMNDEHPPIELQQSASFPKYLQVGKEK